MVFEQIEQLKSQYTDKYVVVDESRPELRRFRRLTGVVKTVNMNGRALVEFNGAENIGWYDIDLDFLKVVDKPQESAPPKKPATAAKPTKESAKPAAAAKPAKAGGGMSVDDILAAARGGGGSTSKASPSKPAEKKESAAPKAKPGAMSVDEILAAARGQAPTAEAAKKPAAETPKAAPTKPGEMTVEEILAAARGQASAPPADRAESPPEAQEKETAEDSAVATPSAGEAEADDGPLPTSVPEIIEYCRKRDG